MNFSNKDKLLIIAAHPDDETLGCGGTIAKAVINKAKAKVIFIGEGVSARFPIGKELSDISIKHNKIRENEARQALKILQINDYSFADEIIMN